MTKALFVVESHENGWRVNCRDCNWGMTLRNRELARRFGHQHHRDAHRASSSDITEGS